MNGPTDQLQWKRNSHPIPQGQAGFHMQQVASKVVLGQSGHPASLSLLISKVWMSKCSVNCASLLKWEALLPLQYVLANHQVPVPKWERPGVGILVQRRAPSVSGLGTESGAGPAVITLWLLSSEVGCLRFLNRTSLGYFKCSILGQVQNYSVTDA